MLSAVAFSEIVGAVYDCALDPGLWPSALTLIRRELRFHNATLSLIDLRTSEALIHIISGIEEPWLGRIALYREDVLTQWGGPDRLDRYAVGEPYVLTEVNPDGVSEGNRYFAEWAKPQGLVDSVAAILALDPSAVGNVAFGRHETQGPVTARELDALRLLMPHLRRAVAISRTLELKQLTAATFEAVVHRLSTAVLLIEASGRLVYANAAGEAVLRKGSPLEIQAGKIVAVAQAGQKSLCAALASLERRPEAGVPSVCVEIPVRGREGDLFVLHLLPLGAAMRNAAVTPTAAAAIFVSPNGARLGPRNALLAELFGLTPTEGRVFDLAATGAQPVEIARTLGVGVSTVRTHLLRLFDKTGVRRHAELVALAASFEAPVGRG